MSDSKQNYSDAAGNYKKAAQENADKSYEDSKAREKRYGILWEKHPVNLNELVATFAPNSQGEVHGSKYIFKGENYSVVADMAAGYARVFSYQEGKHLVLEAPIGKYDGTHFKIKKREDME